MTKFRAGKYIFDLNSRTLIMGILNVTPDSFSDGGQWNSVENALFHTAQMIHDGADIIDIGAQSTRPGYTQISPQEECERLIPILNKIKAEFDIPVSIDTFYPLVAKESIKSGAEIINDITGLRDTDMLSLIAKTDASCVIMHDRSDGYPNGVTQSVVRFFEERIETCKSVGIPNERICLDPGIGFGKTMQENYQLLREMKETCIGGLAYLSGCSRKRIIGCVNSNPPFNERLAGTIAAHTASILSGANIIRVHDVKEAVQAARVTDAIMMKNGVEIIG